MSLRGGIRARERMLAWDENRRFAYRVEEINMPGIWGLSCPSRLQRAAVAMRSRG